MTSYLQFPAVDEELNFPPEVRAKLVESVEAAVATGGAGNWTLGPNLNTANLNTIVQTGIYRQPTPANGTTALNYPYANATGELIVYEQIDDVAVIQEWYPLWTANASRVRYERNLTNNVWSPWRIYRTSRFSESAGRTVYMWDDINNREQLVYGDTGVRDILSMINTANATVGTAKLRRVGHQVELRVLGVLYAGTGGTSANNVSILNAALPAGFRNEHTVQVQAFMGDDLQTSAALAFNGSSLTMKYLRTTNPSASFLMQWQTLDSWPTTLPGNPVGSLPNA